MMFHLEEGKTAAQLTARKWDIGITGTTVDDRGTAATDFAQQTCNRVASLRYDPQTFSFRFNALEIGIDDFRSVDLAFAGASVLLDCTTLGFVELLYCCAKLHDCKQAFSCLYIEPYLYKLSGRTPLLHRRDFELSEEVPGYQGIPGFTLLLDQGARVRTVFFLGYEERRLDRALEDFHFLRPEESIVVFGVPAFRPGWEMDAFANNVRVIRERDVRGAVMFCGAENPKSAYEILENIHGGLADEEKLLIAPIGTKPCGIGAALFAIMHPDTGILYDHPRKRSERSQRVGNWHLYGVSF